MVNDELDRIRERIEQNRTSNFTDRLAVAGKPAPAECRMGCTFFAGDRVLDLVTGLDGTVETVTRDNIVDSAPRSSTTGAGATLAGLPRSEIVETVSVRLTDDRVVARRVRELVKRPTPPGVAR